MFRACVERGTHQQQHQHVRDAVRAVLYARSCVYLAPEFIVCDTFRCRKRYSETNKLTACFMRMSV